MISICSFKINMIWQPQAWGNFHFTCFNIIIVTISRIKNFSPFHFQEFIIDNLKGETSMRMVSRFALSISKLYSSHFYCSNFQDNSDYNNLKGETTNEPNEDGEEVGQSEDEHQYCKLTIAKPEAKQ